MPYERDIQAAFIERVRWAENADERLRLSYAVPNGAWTRNFAVAQILRKTGLRPGVPDWCLPLPVWSKRIAGLRIEFKRPKERMTQEQKAYASLAAMYGWRVVVCFSADEAWRIVSEYLAEVENDQSPTPVRWGK